VYVKGVAVLRVGWSHCTFETPPFNTTLHHSPVCSLCSSMGSPGWMGLLVLSGRTGVNCSGRLRPSPTPAAGQYMKLVTLSTRQVPGPKTL
jgi:hypothetical protein